MTNKLEKINSNTDLVQYFLTLELSSFEDWCLDYSQRNILTKSLREKAQVAWQEAARILEQQRQEELARRQAATIERAKAELAAALEEVKKTLPEMVRQVRDRIARELELINKPFDWVEIDHPLVNGEWQLHFNNYECWQELATETYDESPDGMRSGGRYSVWKTREKGPGSYWTNSITGNKEFFVSRAKTKDGPIPDVVYPHCTIDSDHKEIMWYKEQQIQKRRRAQEWICEAEKALADVNLKWILTTVNYPLYNRICRKLCIIHQVSNAEDLNSSVKKVLSSLQV